MFTDKPAGLVVDYIGIAAELKAALAHYLLTDQAQSGIDAADAVAPLLEPLDVSRTHGTEAR